MKIKFVAVFILACAGISAAYSYPELKDGSYTIINRHSGKALDVLNASTDNGAAVVQWTKHGNANQIWTLKNVRGDDFQITNALNKRPLSVEKSVSDDGKDGDNIVVRDGHSQWMIRPTSEGYYTVAASAGGRHLDVHGSSTADGGKVVQWAANGGNNQEWLIMPVKLSAPADVTAAAGEGIVTLNWKPVTSGSTMFNIRRSTSRDSGFQTIASGFCYHTFHDSFVQADTTYYYKVSATNGTDETAGSKVVSATPRTGKKDHPAGPRVIVTTDGEADDRCSFIRFLLMCNEFDVEGIVNSSSEFHWVDGGTGWNAFHPVSWVKDHIDLYAQVYENLLLHDPDYPSPAWLLSRWRVGNIDRPAGDDFRTEGAELIARVLLGKSDPRPVWVQAWGGCNTLSRALKIIQEDHPSEMKEVAEKLHVFLIWEQDTSYQEYIRPDWEHLGVTVINSDQFDCMAYIWADVLPADTRTYFEAPWMQSHILNDHGPLCSSYGHINGAFHAEGDTPAFLHAVPNGLRSTESPAWGGWGGRYVKVRNNVWMDVPPDDGRPHPEGRWFINNSWSKSMLKYSEPEDIARRTRYFKPVWRWLDDVQNDFAARADWCVSDYSSANHHPLVRINSPADLRAAPGETVTLDASASTDPDGDRLIFNWWHYSEADTYTGAAIPPSGAPVKTVTIPPDVRPGEEIHLVCEVTDTGTPPLTGYLRVVIRVTSR